MWNMLYWIRWFANYNSKELFGVVFVTKQKKRVCERELQMCMLVFRNRKAVCVQTVINYT